MTRPWPARTTAVALLVAALIAVPGPGLSKSRDLLPNLMPLAPAGLIGPETALLEDFGYGYPAPPLAVNGCLVDEIVRKAALRCLRFETVVANAGPGDFEILYKAEAPSPGAYQVIHQRGGATRERFAVASEYHPTHLHFHFRNFYSTKLWLAGPGASRSGAEPIAAGEKSGFCPEDTTQYRGGGDAHYSCLGDYRTDEMSAGQVVGISSGWADSYRTHLPDQFIEITGVADGRYILEMTIDPDDAVVESNERDNSICVLFKLAGSAVTGTRTISCR